MTHPKNVEDQDQEQGKDDENEEENLPDSSQVWHLSLLTQKDTITEDPQYS